MSISFQVPQVISYTCQACGDCCTNDYGKPLSLEEKEQLQELYPDEDFFDSSEKGGCQLKEAGKGCWFLQEDGTCRIHNEHGLEAKPTHCRRFPYSFQRIKDTVYIGYSYACRYLKPFPRIPDQKPWEKLYSQFKDEERVLPTSISIFPDKSIPLELYLQMENYFMIFMKTEEFSLDIPERLIGLHVFFSMLRQFILLPENKGRPFDSNCALFLSGLGQTNFKTIIETSEKLRGAENQRYRRFWWFISDYLHSIARYRALPKTRKILAVFRQNMRSAAQYKQYQSLSVQPDWNHPFIHSYYIHLWERKNYIHPSIDISTLVKYFLIMLGVISVRYKYLMINHEDMTPDEAIKGAIKFIELHYGYHVQEIHKIVQNPRLKKYLNLLDKSPLSVSSLFHI